MEFRMLLLVFFGKDWEQIFWEKSWQKNLMNLLYSPWTIMITQAKKTNSASLIGSFNPAWDSEDNNDEAFFQAVSVAGMILDHKFERYLGNERADQRVNELLKAKEEQSLENTEDGRILVLPEFVPCQKRLSETQIAFVIFPSNRGGYCIQPQKKNIP